MMAKRYILLAAALGGLLPALWMLLYHSNASFGRWWIQAPSWVETVRTVLWPTAILLLADPHDTNAALRVVSALSNAVLYAVAACIVSRCIARHTRPKALR